MPVHFKFTLLEIRLVKGCKRFNSMVHMPWKYFSKAINAHTTGLFFGRVVFTMAYDFYKNVSMSSYFTHNSKYYILVCPKKDFWCCI